MDSEYSAGNVPVSEPPSLTAAQLRHAREFFMDRTGTVGIRSDFPRSGALGGGDTDGGSEAGLPAAALGRPPCFGLAFRERTGWLSGMGSGGASRACRSARLITSSVSARLRQTVEDSVPTLNGFPPLAFTPAAVKALIMSRQPMPRRSAASNQCICPATSCESFLCPPPGRWKSSAIALRPDSSFCCRSSSLPHHGQKIGGRSSLLQITAKLCISMQK